MFVDAAGVVADQWDWPVVWDVSVWWVAPAVGVWWIAPVDGFDIGDIAPLVYSFLVVIQIPVVVVARVVVIAVCTVVIVLGCGIVPVLAVAVAVIIAVLIIPLVRQVVISVCPVAIGVSVAFAILHSSAVFVIVFQLSPIDVLIFFNGVVLVQWPVLLVVWLYGCLSGYCLHCAAVWLCFISVVVSLIPVIIFVVPVIVCIVPATVWVLSHLVVVLVPAEVHIPGGVNIIVFLLLAVAPLFPVIGGTHPPGVCITVPRYLHLLSIDDPVVPHS